MPAAETRLEVEWGPHLSRPGAVMILVLGVWAFVRARTVRKLVSRSRCPVVVAQQAAQAVATTNSGATDRAGHRRDQIVVEALMVPFPVVVRHKLLEHVQ